MKPLLDKARYWLPFACVLGIVVFLVIAGLIIVNQKATQSYFPRDQYADKWFWGGSDGTESHRIPYSVSVDYLLRGK